MNKSTITREQAQKIIVAADEVITALAGTNEDVHPEDSKKMCELWDDLNDRYAPPVVVRELARMALAAIDSEPVVFTDERNLHHIAMGRETSLIWGKQNSEAGDVPLYRHPQPAPVVPDGYVLVPKEPTRQMMSQGHFAMKGTDRGKFRRIYQAMIAAAQQELK